MSTASQFDPLNQFIQRLGPLANASPDRTINTQQSGTNVDRSRGSAADIGIGVLDAIFPF